MPIAQGNATRVAIIIIAISLLAGLSACSKPAPQAEPVRAVKVQQIGLGGLEANYEYSGEVRARVESRLGFRVAGKITKRQAEVGQRVAAGQVLAQIDPQDYKLATDAARALVAAASTNRDLAAADFKRFAALKDQNFISGAELERREAALKAAQAQLDQAQVQLKTQGNQAGYTTLVADVAGVVTAVEAEPGQVVSAGTPVVRIAQDGPRDVVFSVPEDRVRLLAVGATVSIRRWAQAAGATDAAGQRLAGLQGRVREVGASADPITRTFPVKVAVDAASAPALGSTVTVLPDSLVAAVQVLKLPTSALFQQGQDSYVWVLDKTSMTVKNTQVQIATADGNEAVIAAGLAPGAWVVTAGVHVLQPGQKVTIFKDNTAIAQGNAGQAATKTVVPQAALAAANSAAASTAAPDAAAAATAK